MNSKKTEAGEKLGKITLGGSSSNSAGQNLLTQQMSQESKMIDSKCQQQNDECLGKMRSSLRPGIVLSGEPERWQAKHFSRGAIINRAKEFYF